MKILVTGHEGFIGSHVSEHLRSLGYEVDGISFPDDIKDWIDFVYSIQMTF